MITYNDLYERLRAEKYAEQLQALPKSFISDIADYLKEKKEISNKEGDMFSDVLVKTKKQYENAVSIFKELMLRRKKKLLNLAFVATEIGISKRDFENMLGFEKELFDKIMNGINDAEKELGSLMDGKREESGNVMVSFLDDTGEFVDMAGEKMGPFSKGDVANLPKDIAKILTEAGKAERIEED